MGDNNGQSSHHEQLMAHLMGVLGGMNGAPAANAYAMGNRTRFVIPAGNAVVSSNPLSSSLTTSSSATSGPSSSPLGGIVGAPATAAAALPNNAAAVAPAALAAPIAPVPEFLFQLTKMLTDDNAQYIEWRDASVFVHDPPGLEKDILPKYFRHSNYSSFQRQMNYFGFRKIAGKGKMGPCSYVNESAKDIPSLLSIQRRKRRVSSAAARLMAQQNSIIRSLGDAGPGRGGGSTGVEARSPLVGGALPDAPPRANPSIALHNNSMAGGATGNNTGNSLSATVGSGLGGANVLLQSLQNTLAQPQQPPAAAFVNSQVPSIHLGGCGGAVDIRSMVGGATGNNAGSILPAAVGSGLGGTNVLLQSLQNTLIQLQQPPAATFVNCQVPNIHLGGGRGAVGIPLAAQKKALDDIGSSANNNGANTMLSNPTDWSNPAAIAAAQSLFVRQATQGLSGNSASNDGVEHLDPAAGLRALINQQISMFNNPGLASAAKALRAPELSVAGMVQPQGPAAQQVQAHCK